MSYRIRLEHIERRREELLLFFIFPRHFFHDVLKGLFREKGFDFIFLKLGFKSQKELSNTCCRKCVEHIDRRRREEELLFFIYLFTFSTTRIKQLISAKEAYFKMASLPFFSCLKPLEDKVIGETVNSRVLAVLPFFQFVI